MTSWYWLKERNNSLADVKRRTPRTGPHVNPSPPAKTIIRYDTDLVKLKLNGERYPYICAKRLPAIPARTAEIVNARTFIFVTSTPMNSAAVSSSRTDRSARPSSESTSVLISQ